MSLKKEERAVSTEDRLAANATAGKPGRLRHLQLPLSTILCRQSPPNTIFIEFNNR